MVQFVRARMRTYVRALGIAGHDPRRRGPPPGHGRAGHPPLQRAGSAGHALPRDPHQVGPEPRPEPLARRSTGRSTRIEVASPCVSLLLRPPDARVPGLQRGAGLRARDHRQGQRAGGAAGRAGAAVVGERVALGTNTDPYQWVEGRYKLMRGIWEAFRDFKNPCSILTKSPLLLRDLDLMKEIAKGHGDQRVPVGAHARREGVAGDGAAHAASAGAAGGGGGAQPQRHPDRRADGAADARDQRRAGAGGEDRRAGDRGERDLHRRPDAVPARLGARHLLRVAARAPAGPGGALRAPVREGRVPVRPGAPQARACRRRAVGAAGHGDPFRTATAAGAARRR